MASGPPNPPETRDLAAFVAAVEAASMHSAADALNLTQSAVTKRIQALERRLGVALLDRGRLGVWPTDAGRTLYPEAKQALEALARAETLLSDRAQEHVEKLSLAASHTIGEFLLPAWLGAMRWVLGPLRAHVDVVNSQGVVRLVREGEAQVGFVEGLDSLSGLEALDLLEDEIVAVVSGSHPWARRRAVTMADLAQEPYLTREEGSGTRSVAEAALARGGIELTPALEVGSTGGLKRAVLGGGFALLSRLAVEREELSGELHAVTVAGVDTRRRLRSVRPHSPGLPGAATRFWHWLEREVAAPARVADDT